MLIDIAIIVLAALLGTLIFNKIGLPGILGMVAARVLLGFSGPRPGRAPGVRVLNFNSSEHTPIIASLKLKP